MLCDAMFMTFRISHILGLLTLSATFPSPAADSPTSPIMKSEFIYETAPFPACHASTIVESKNGLIAAWFGGTAEKNPDVGIWLSHFKDGRWTAPVEVANGVESPKLRYASWNPVLFQPKSAPLMLFYKVGPSPSQWWGMMKTSEDGGQTWSKPQRLPSGILGPIKNKPVQLPNGDILCPTSTENHGWQVHFERTEDGGKTWGATQAVNDGTQISAIQPSILFHDGSLQAIGRTRQGKIFSVESKDAGHTWSAMTLLDVPNPSSGIDALTLRDGRHLLVYNNTPSGRTPLNVALSADGKSWTSLLALESGAGEFSYPAVIQSRDGLVHITYTWNRKKIKHVILDPALLKAP